MEPSPKREQVDVEAILAAPQDSEANYPLPGQDLSYPEDQSFEFIRDGLKFATYRWLPAGEPKGIIVILHGMNAYVGRTAHMGKHYADAGFVVVGFDQRGHGLSEGLTGYLVPMKTVVEDTDAFVQTVEKLHPGLPIFLTGQSFGGALAFRMSREFPARFKGLVLWNPAILEYKDQMKVGKAAAKFLSYLIPTWGVAPSTKQGIALRNPKHTDLTWDDPLIYTGKIRPGTVQVVLSAMSEAHAKLGNVTAPYLLLQGGGDKVVNPLGAFDAMERTQSTDKEFLYYPQTWHDFWHEPEIFDALEKTTEWMLARI